MSFMQPKISAPPPPPAPPDPNSTDPQAADKAQRDAEKAAALAAQGQGRAATVLSGSYGMGQGLNGPKTGSMSSRALSGV